MKKICNLIYNPLFLLVWLDRHNVIRINDKLYISILYKTIFKRKINLNNPQTFNEKLQYLKLHDRNELYTDIVDKNKVKSIVANIIGKKYIIPTIGVWNDAKDIDFDKLPNSFVLKCTHDSGSIVICEDKNKLDINKTVNYLNEKLNKNFYYCSREWPYKNVTPMIIAEEYLGKNINDYKIQCFNGKSDNIMICDGRFTDRGVRYYYFDCDWNYLPYCQYDDIDSSIFTYSKPDKLDEMIELSNLLSKNFKQVRVDWYVINGNLYFGELTFYTNGGYDTTITNEADLVLGKKLNLDGEENEN